MVSKSNCSREPDVLRKWNLDQTGEHIAHHRLHKYFRIKTKFYKCKI